MRKENVGQKSSALGEIGFHWKEGVVTVLLASLGLAVSQHAYALSAAGQALMWGNPDDPNAPGQDQEEKYVFKKNVDEVVLHVTVVNEQGELAQGLGPENFLIKENGRPQRVTSVRHEDVPVCLGILIDSSGSMRKRQHAVHKAASNLLRMHLGQDQMFVQDLSLDLQTDQDFTSDVGQLERAFRDIKVEGKSTAIYDGIARAAEHLALCPSQIEKKILVVITDGVDNYSMTPLGDAIEAVRSQRGPVIYTIGLIDEIDREPKKAASDALNRFASATGGKAFFPYTEKEITGAASDIAADIRSQYVVHYVPDRSSKTGDYHEVKVEVQAPGQGQLTARTREGYRWEKK